MAPAAFRLPSESNEARQILGVDGQWDPSRCRCLSHRLEGSIAGLRHLLPPVGVHELGRHSRRLLRSSKMKVHRFGISKHVNECRLRAVIVEVVEEDKRAGLLCLQARSDLSGE